MIDAVLFDWGDTLFRSAYDEGVLRSGWEAGLAAMGRDGVPDPGEAARRFRDHYEPRIYERGRLDEVDYPAIVRELLGEFGCEPTAAELERFLVAEHQMEIPARRESWVAHELLDALHARGLRLGLVSNACDPGELLRRDLEWMGLAERLDAVAFSSEVGKRKPHPAPFEAVLGRLGVAPGRALFVGDRRYEDVWGASELGMTTVLARWFRRDDGDERGVDPDFEAFAPADVLEIILRLAEPRPAPAPAGT